MDPNEFARSDWVNGFRAKVESPPQEAPRTVQGPQEGLAIRKTLDHFVVSESLEGKLENVDVVNEYLTSSHYAVSCTIKLQESEKWIKQLKMPQKLPGASVQKANDTDKDDRQNWDLKQDIRYLEEASIKERTLSRVLTRRIGIWGRLSKNS